MILLMAHTELEIQHIKDEPWLSKKIIGCGDTCLKYTDQINQEHYSTVILFGCCGLIKKDLPYLGKLYVLDSVNYSPVGLFADEYKKHALLGAIPARGITTPTAVHSKNESVLLRQLEYDIVDMESSHIMKICTRPLIIIRYGVDYLDKKLNPFPFNHHTRILQHYLCQRKMNKVLNSIWFRGAK